MEEKVRAVHVLIPKHRAGRGAGKGEGKGEGKITIKFMSVTQSDNL